MILRPRTGLWILLVAAVLAAAFAWYMQRGKAMQRPRAPWAQPWVERDLDLIQQDTLRVLVLRDPLTWEQRPGAETGLELELLERFANKNGLQLRVLPMDDRDSMYMALQQGKGDVIAAQYAPVPEERGWFKCTRTYMSVAPVLARIRPAVGTKAEAVVAAADSAQVSWWSPFKKDAAARAFPRARVMQASPEEVLMDVVVGKASAALVTSAIAAHEGTRLSALEFVPLEGEEQGLCFALRTNAPQLQKAFDAWFHAPEEDRFRTVLIDGYLDRSSKPGALKKRTMPAATDSISPYDAEFHEHGQGFGWKWQLLTAMAWKESRFDSTAVSHKGAQGIMQFMPNTAAHFGLDTAMSVAHHIQAAKRYITRLDTLWMRAVPDRDQRLRFVLASYNAGVGHIIDAQRLAERLGLDPQRWEDHVERAVLLLAKPRYYMRPEMKNGFCKGSQVFHYVRDIVALYHQLTGLPRISPPVRQLPTEPPVEELALPDPELTPVQDLP